MSDIESRITLIISLEKNIIQIQTTTFSINSQYMLLLYFFQPKHKLFNAIFTRLDNSRLIFISKYLNGTLQPLRKYNINKNFQILLQYIIPQFLPQSYSTSPKKKRKLLRILIRTKVDRYLQDFIPQDHQAIIFHILKKNKKKKFLSHPSIECCR